MIQFRNLTALIIDDMQDMRGVLRIQLSQLGVTRIHQAATIRDAMRLIRDNRYDVILCDYYMGDDTSGQQFLEYLRSGNYIPPHTLFVMVTAECSYESVANAVEYAPDDYLVKPFTAELLRTRMERIWNRKETLTPVLNALAAKNFAAVVAECDRLLAQKCRYTYEVLRIRGKALLTIGDFDAAEALYEGVMAQKPYGWAKYGLACAKAGRERLDDAKAMLQTLIAETPAYLDAYDKLSSLYEAEGNSDKALEVTLSALEVGPSVKRQREAGLLAMENGDLALAEALLTKAVERNKFGFMKSAEEYTALAKVALVGKEPFRALKVLAEAYDLNLINRAVETMTAKAVEAEAQLQMGNTNAAKTALSLAVASQEAAPPEETQEVQRHVFELARIAMESGHTELAQRVLAKAVSDDHENAELVSRAKDFFREVAGDAGADGLDANIREIFTRNNEAVSLARHGDLAEASKIFEVNAKAQPNNYVLALNCAKAFVMLAQSTKDIRSHEAAINKYLDQAEAIRPMQPSLIQLRNVWEKMKGASK